MSAICFPIKNGYQLESYCPNVQFLAFFPCAYHIFHASVCCKGRCMGCVSYVSFIFAIVPIDA